MIRTALAPRPVRAGATLAAVAGIALLAGCAPATESAADEPSAANEPSEEANSNESEATGSGSYADGTYTADGTYATPETVETIAVTVTLEGDVITDVEVTGEPQRSESEQYQGEFIGGIAEVVVGENIDDIEVSRVAGSSLTSGGFNEAIEAIKADAAQ